MARSHHRKKHKTNLRQYQQTHEEGSPTPKKTGVSGTIAIIGVVLGMAIGYLVTDGNLTWVVFGALVGGLAGYLSGRYIQRRPTR